jgi:DNA (cytosine-5)-methyltransferase 1
MRNRLTLLSAFSGLGGLDLGLEAANFHHLGSIENDECARRSITTNREDIWPLLDPGDISLLSRSIAPRDLGLRRRELSLLAGGPPCQPFSKAAQWSPSARQGLQDPRSRCLHDFLRLIDVFLPRVVLIENVSGFISGKVSALADIESALIRINRRNKTHYAVQSRLIDSLWYGVPQSRVRAVIVITREGELLTWPRPTHSDRPVRAWDAIGSLNGDESLPPTRGSWADLLPSIPEGWNYLWHTNHGGGSPLFGYRTRFWSFLLKLAKNQPSWTLPAQPGPSTGPFHWENRPLTIREMLRLQTFPSSWAVEGTYREQVRQVGNATPPLLAEVVGRMIAIQVFRDSFASDRLRHGIRRVQRVPRASRVAPVSPEYIHLRGPHRDHPGTGKGPRPRALERPQPLSKYR